MNLKNAYMRKVQGLADDVGGYTQQGFGTPGHTVETELGIKDTGQAWSEDGTKVIEAQAIGEILGAIADKVNEVILASQTGTLQQVVQLTEADF